MDKPENEPNGWISIHTFVDSFYVVLNNDFENILQVANHDTIRVEAGKHQVRLIKRYYRDTIQTVEVEPGTLHPLRMSIVAFDKVNNDKYFSSYPRIFWNTAAMVKTDRDAEIYIDGEYAGTGLAKVTGQEDIKIQSLLPSGKSRTITYNPADHSSYFNVVEFYNSPVKSRLIILSVIPGFGQFYQRRYLRGSLIVPLFWASVGAGIYFNNQFVSNYDEFNYFTRLYNTRHRRPDDSQILSGVVLEYGNAAEYHLNEARRTANLRDLALYSAAGVYLYSIIDSLFIQRTGFRKKIHVDPFIDFHQRAIQGAGITAAYNFN